MDKQVLCAEWAASGACTPLQAAGSCQRALFRLPDSAARDGALCSPVILQPLTGSAGECERNKNFMVGDDFSLGACRAACGACELCRAGDTACRNRNRERAGYLPLHEDPGIL